MAACILSTLGAFSLSVDARPVRSPATQKARALLAYLVMHRNSDVARERLVELFWPDAEPERARESLRTALYSIRRVLRDAGCEPDALLHANNAAVRWKPETEFDAERLEELAKCADADAHARALALYRGEFLEADYDEWTVVERERIAGVYERLLARAHAAGGDADVARRLIERNPYDEAPYVTLVEAELAARRVESASKIVKSLRAALSEVGAVPSLGFEERYGDLERVERPERAMPQLPFCGRERELAQIRQILDAGPAREDRLIVVHGQPGIGKTSLLEQAFGLATRAGLGVLSVRSVEVDPRPFGIWGSLYESLGLGEFSSYLRGSAGDVTRPLASALCEAFAKRTFVCVDDVHYLRGDQFAMLVAFVRAALAAGHVVCVGTRPEGLRMLDGVLGETPRVELALETLQSTELAEGLEAAGFANVETCARMLAEKTGGLPLFVASLLEELAKDGDLRRRGVRWELMRGDITSLALPRTLARSIESRIRSRGARAASAACALALEPDANAGDLRAVLDCEEDVVLDALDDLLALGIVIEPASGKRFAFAHDVVREVAASLLHRVRRERIHAAFADRLGSVEAGDGLMRRAKHEEACGRFLAAAETYFVAGRDALSVRAFHEASARCDLGLESAARAVEVRSASAVSARLCGRKAAIADRSGNVSQAVAAVEAAVGHARASQDQRVLAFALNWSAGVLDNARRWNDALRDARAGLDIANALADEKLRSQMLTRLISAHQSLHDHAAAAALGDEAIAAAVASNEPTPVAVAAGTVFRGRLTVWSFAAALRALEVQEAWARRCGVFSEKFAATNRGFFWYHMGRPDLALRSLPTSEEVMAAAERIVPTDIVASVGDVLMSLELLHALVGAGRGDFGPSLRLSTLAERLPDITWSATALHCMTAARIDALLALDGPGDLERAEGLIATITDDAFEEASLERGSAYAPYVLRARVAARRGSHDAHHLVAYAIDAAEGDATRMPTDCFRALQQLGEAAAEIAATSLAMHAFDLRDAQLARHARATLELTGVRERQPAVL